MLKLQALKHSVNAILSVYSYILFLYSEHLGQAVAQLVEALRYKPEGRRFDP